MENNVTSSGSLIVDTQVTTQSGALQGIILIADGTNQATASVWDSENSTTTGKVLLAKIIVDAGLVYEESTMNRPIVVNRGIYVDLTGTGAEAIVYYMLGA